VYIPASLEENIQRMLSLDLGNGDCLWQPPAYDVPNNIDFHKTVIAGYPSGDKRMIFLQMEALTGWPAKDEWDFKYLGITNHPFIKANYPHHEGIWGWGGVADQVVLMIKNMRESLVEYHDILWDLDYEKMWEDITISRENDLYSEQPPMEDFLAWRDGQVLDECCWYAWFIDYWMEGGLMRDIFSHRLTTPKHWNLIVLSYSGRNPYHSYDLIVGTDTVVPHYDPHCANGDISGGCEPVAVLSGEKLRDQAVGASETAAIANVLHKNDKMGQFVIDSSTWDCIWKELIVKGVGVKTVYDRPPREGAKYNFSAEMLEMMVSELTYVIDKYSGPDWNTKATANRIVELLVEHRGLIEVELSEVKSGARRLTSKDFLGPKMRAERRGYKIEGNVETGVLETVRENSKYADYFSDLQKTLQEKKQVKRMARAARVHRRRRDRIKEAMKQGKMLNLDRDNERLEDLADWRKYLRENRGKNNNGLGQAALG